MVATGLGLAMVALQAGIGAANDVVDAPRDAGHKPGKPIPAGLVSQALARRVVVVAFAVGLSLAALSGGAAAVALAIVGVAIGLAYDFRLKGTAWSWLPFAVGIPVLPVFSWIGATGNLPIAFLVTERLGNYGWTLFMGLPFFCGFSSALIYCYHVPRSLRVHRRESRRAR